jgi:hypothetical protein
MISLVDVAHELMKVTRAEVIYTFDYCGHALSRRIFPSHAILPAL